MRQRVILGAALAALLSAGVTFAQAVPDDGTRSPTVQLFTRDQVASYFVFGDNAIGNVIADVGQLRSVPESESDDIISLLTSQANRLPAPYLYELARRLVSVSEERAVYYYLLARSRIAYASGRCVDSSSSAVATSLADFGRDVEPLLEDVALVRLQVASIYESGAAFESDASPWWICSSSDSVFYAASNGATLSRDEWLKPESLWPEVRDAVNENLRINLAILDAALGVEAMDD